MKSVPARSSSNRIRGEDELGPSRGNLDSVQGERERENNGKKGGLRDSVKKRATDIDDFDGAGAAGPESREELIFQAIHEETRRCGFRS